MAQACARDVSLTAQIDTVLFEATSNCNLRCTYCRVSSPTYSGKNFDFSHIEKIADQMAAANVRSVQISGHGETTILPHWPDYCRVFFERGIGVRITSNFGKRFSADEIDVLARMLDVTISIDTADRNLLKRLRRRVNLQAILDNMRRVRLASVSLHGRQPSFNWQCTLSDRVVSGLPEWVDMGLLNGVRTFTLCNLIEHNDLPDVLARENAPLARHIARMEHDQLLAACASIRSAVARARQAGAIFIIQPGTLEGINERLRTSGIRKLLQFSPISSLPGMIRGAGSLLALGEPTEMDVVAPAGSASGTVGHDIDGGQSQTVNVPPQPGETRDCLDPWYQPFLLANGDLWPCPWFYSRLGNVHEEPFDQLVNGAAFRRLRQELLTGKLRPACSQCPSRSITTPALLLERLTATMPGNVGAVRTEDGGPSSGIFNRTVRVLARVAQRYVGRARRMGEM